MQTRVLSFLCMTFFEVNMIAGDLISSKSALESSSGKSRFDLSCKLSFLNKAITQVDLHTENHSIVVQMTLDSLASNRMTEEEAAFEIANDELKVLMKNRFFATIVAVHLRKDGFKSPDALENAVRDFKNRSEEEKLRFVDRVTLSLIETIGPTLYSTSPASEKVNQQLSEVFDLSLLARDRFRATWQMIVQHDYRDLRAYVWYVLEHSYDRLAEKVRGTMGIKHRLLRHFGFSFRPIFIPESTLPSRVPKSTVQNPTVVLGRESLRHLSAESISFIVSNELDRYSLEDLKILEQTLRRKDSVHRNLLVLQTQTELLERVNTRHQQLSAALNTNIQRLFDERKEALANLAELLKEVSRILGPESVELKFDLPKEEARSVTSMDHFQKMLEQEKLLLSPTTFTPESPALAQLKLYESKTLALSAFTEELLVLAENHQLSAFEEFALSTLLDSYDARSKEEMTRMMIDSLEDEISSILRAFNDGEKKTIAHSALVKIIRSNLSRSEKKILILRVCLRLGDNQTGLRNDQNLIAAFESVRHATILSELHHDEIDEIWTRISNKLRARRLDSSDNILVKELLSGDNWRGSRDYEDELIDKMTARIIELKTTEIVSSLKSLQEKFGSFPAPHQ